MKYIRIWDVKTLGNEPGRLVEKERIDQKKIKKIEIKNIGGQTKHLLTFGEEKGKIYIISKITETMKSSK
jgi:hypothetical protein